MHWRNENIQRNAMSKMIVKVDVISLLFSKNLLFAVKNLLFSTFPSQTNKERTKTSCICKQRHRVIDKRRKSVCKACLED